MGRGAKARTRWKNDRIRKKKARDKRKAVEAHAKRSGTATAASPAG